MDLPLGNFFEVTINSNKLFSLIGEMTTQLKDQQTHIKRIDSALKNTLSNVDTRLKDRNDNTDVQLQKLKKGMQEEVNYMRLFMRDVDKKATDKIGELQNAVLMIKDNVMNKIAKIDEEGVIRQSYMHKKLAAIDICEEDIKNNNQQIQNIKSSIQISDEKITNHHEQLDFDLKRVKAMMQKLQDRLIQTQKKLKQDKQPISMRNSFVQQKSRKQIKQEEMKSQCFLNIVNRIQEFQNNLTEHIPPSTSHNITHNPRRSNVSNNKFVSSNLASRSQFGPKKTNKFNQFQEIVCHKLENIEVHILQKIQHFQKEIYKITNKVEVVDQHVGILSRKLQKQKVKMAQIGQSVQHFQDKKIDQKAIENIKNMVKKFIKDFQEHLQKKFDKQAFQKQKLKIKERIEYLSNMLGDKAQKSEVKKGFSFFEDKIKEMIVVLAEQRGNAQDGAIKKTPFKCLSCDKDLQSQKQQLTGRNKQNPNMTHYNTTQMRKRIRLVNNTVSTMQFNDD